MKTYIYVLIDPRDNTVRYVGKANRPEIRYSEHMTTRSLSTKTMKNQWIKKLKGLSLRPKLEIIEECSGENWEERERYWIAYYRQISPKLTNMTDGGDGTQMFGELNPMYGKPSPLRGIPRSEETKEKLRQRNKGLYVSPETREKQRINNTGTGNPSFGKKHKNTSSKYFGVVFSGGKYIVCITENMKDIRIGQYHDEILAAKAYDYYVTINKIIERPLNFPDDRGYTELEIKLFTDEKFRHGLSLHRRNDRKPKSGYRGVTYTPEKNYTATLMNNRKVKHLGRFSTPELAALAYNKAATEIYGEYAVLNILPENLSI